MHVQGTQDPARGTDSGPELAPFEALTLVRELASLCSVLAGIADRLSRVEASGENSRELPGPLGLCPPVDGGPVSAVTAFIDVSQPADRPADGGGVLLRALLRERHWQTYGTFCREYDRAAKTVDPDLVGTWPSRVQLHRWVSGGLKGLPYADHCRVLEAMLPGYHAGQLFATVPAADAPARLRVVPG